MKAHQLEDALRSLKLFGMLDTLGGRLAQASAGELGTPSCWPCCAPTRRHDATPPAWSAGSRRPASSRRPRSRTSTSRSTPRVPAAQIRDLGTLRFVDAGESVILHGPVGVGKSMIAQALGHAACRRGHSVVFTKTSRLLADLAGGHADRTWEARLRRWARPSILILDDFAIRDFTLTKPTTSTSSSPSGPAARPSSRPTARPRTGTRCSPTRWWPSRSSTASSTRPTTSTWTGGPTDPTAGPTRKAGRGERADVCVAGLRQPRSAPARTARSPCDLLLAVVSPVAQRHEQPDPRRRRPRRRRPGRRPVLDGDASPRPSQRRRRPGPRALQRDRSAGNYEPCCTRAPDRRETRSSRHSSRRAREFRDGSVRELRDG